MIYKWSFFTSLTLIIAYLSSGFQPSKTESNDWFFIDEEDEKHYLYPSELTNDYTNLRVPYTGKFFVAYKEAIAQKESQGKYKKVNSLGYMGKYQFGYETLKTVGVDDSRKFLNSPRMQEKAFVALLSKNKSILKEVIEKYEGQVVAGILITESGILAAAHLGGPGSVIKFFRHEGKRYFKDAYGTSIRSYMREFGGYETSGIIADKNASVQ
jgi:hypothetical protein